MVHCPPVSQARAVMRAESAPAPLRPAIESTSHSMRPRLARATVRESARHLVTVSVFQRRAVFVVSSARLPLVRMARMIGVRLRTTARLPLVNVGTCSVTVGGVSAVIR